MAELRNIVLDIDKDVANANVTVTYEIRWSAFEQATDLEFDETWKLIGDDTGEDGDNLPVGDDPISMGLMLVGHVSSNGQATTSRTLTRTISFANLDEDATGSNTDDEIRAVVTLTPRLPVATSRESGKVVVEA